MKNRKQEFEPLVSLIIPAWNEEVGIINTVKSVISNTYPNIEIIVVNDGSTDTTHDIVTQFVKNFKRRKRNDKKKIVYHSKKNEGKGVALNHAIERTKGEIIITMDADSIADQFMVERIVGYFEDPSIDAAVGNVKVAGEFGFINLLQRLEYLFGFYHKQAHSLLGAEYIYGGACAAFRKETVFDKIGLFDTSSITEDIEMSMRTRANGHNAVYADDALCYTEGASTIMGLIKQRTRWKRGRFEAFGRYKKLFLSTKMHHNKWMTWFILPFALLAEIQLLFEPIGVTLLLIYSYITGDYSSLLLGALFMGIMYLVVGLMTEKAKNWWIVPLAPFTWMIFYILVWVEYMALLKSIASLIRAEGLTWQRWQRKGISTSSNSNGAKI
ncbi:glycosyltransferase [Candidatus Saccharibacteria bacterium]|nr:MAG: glycosyltransferase [Candidatus Saccharibacteria bacterium]